MTHEEVSNLKHSSSTLPSIVLLPIYLTPEQVAWAWDKQEFREELSGIRAVPNTGSSALSYDKAGQCLRRTQTSVSETGRAWGDCTPSTTIRTEKVTRKVLLISQFLKARIPEAKVQMNGVKCHGGQKGAQRLCFKCHSGPCLQFSQAGLTVDRLPPQSPGISYLVLSGLLFFLITCSQALIQNTGLGHQPRANQTFQFISIQD